MKLIEEIGPVHMNDFFAFLKLQDSEKSQKKDSEKQQREEDEKALNEILGKTREKEKKANEKEKEKQNAEWVKKEELSEKLLADLKLQCRKHSLPVSGTKKDLLDRLLLHIR